MIESPSEKDDIYLANVTKIGNSVDNIQYTEDILSQEEHATILNYVKTSESWETQPWVAKMIRPNNLPKDIVEILEKIFELVYKKSKNIYKVDIDPYKKYSLNCTKFEKGFHLQPHIDTLSDESLHIASVYYINDDYTGGEINFINHNLKIKPKANSLIIFPGNENYVHEVLEILDSPRYSSSMWFQFTGSNFSKKREWYN
jgi:Rps23 Pro-64 3,4-dihydroxylase Tpa1-like proline 4-hydroxylase